MPVRIKQVIPAEGWDALAVSFDGKGKWRMQRHPVAMWVVAEGNGPFGEQPTVFVTAIHSGNIHWLSTGGDDVDLEAWRDGWWIDGRLTVAYLPSGAPLTEEIIAEADDALEVQLEKNRARMEKKGA